MSHLQAWASNDTYEARVEAIAEDDGTVLRAPTEKQGLIPLCKDTFRGTVSHVVALLAANHAAALSHYNQHSSHGLAYRLHTVARGEIAICSHELHH